MAFIIDALEFVRQPDEEPQSLQTEIGWLECFTGTAGEQRGRCSVRTKVIGPQISQISQIFPNLTAPAIAAPAIGSPRSRGDQARCGNPANLRNLRTKPLVNPQEVKTL